MRPVGVRGRRVLVGDELRPALVLLDPDRGTVAAVADPDLHVDPDGGPVLEVPDSAVVLPGVVDTHVHVNEPGRTAWEGFASATRAAALGGVTTVVDMPLNSLPPTTSVEALAVKRRATEGKLAVDVGFWGGAVPGNLADLAPLWEAGVLGFKCFLAPSGVEEFPPLSPEELDAALHEVARLDALMVVHAEDAGVLARTAAPPSRAYADFLLSRPDEAETAAVRRLLEGARRTGARVHVLHLSAARALDDLAAARQEGLRVTVETCPHYLCLDAAAIPDAAPEFKCCPPIRDDGNREALWQGLLDGVVDCVVSDHSPSTAEEKARGDGDLQQAWGGISSLQVGLAVMVDEATRRGVSPAEVARWMSRHPADLVGLPAKGRIEAGADADLVVLDTDAPWRVRAGELAHRNAVTAYDGLALTAQVTHTVVRGTLVDRADPDLHRGRRLERPAPVAAAL